MSTIKIFKDSEANSIFIEDANGSQFLNSLQASINGNDLVFISDLAKQIDIVSNAVHSDFIDKDNNSYIGDATSICNQLNAIFQSSGTPTSDVPVITSSLSISLTQGETLNYELTSDYGVGYEWDFSNVNGVTTVEGNVRKIIGGSSLVSGTYNIPVKAINYNGEDSETLVLTVATPPFANTKSINFSNQDWLGANASQVSSVLGRSGNGSGSSDAWSISMWYKGSNNQQGQTIFYYGGATTTNEGHITLTQVNVSGGAKQLRLRYGHSFNRIQLQSAGINANTWQHILVTYDGGTTGSGSNFVNDYYSRFKIYIDGVLTTPSASNNNFGYSGDVDSDNFRVGRYSSGNYMRDCRVDELALFDSDQSSNISDIYNSGSPFDLSNLTTEPKHWWRMGDGDTYPYLQDNGTEGNCIFEMNNMTSADIVNDVP